MIGIADRSILALYQRRGISASCHSKRIIYDADKRHQEFSVVRIQRICVDLVNRSHGSIYTGSATIKDFHHSNRVIAVRQTLDC